MIQQFATILLLAAALQAWLWRRSVRQTNAGWVDFGWSLSLAIAAVVAGILGSGAVASRAIGAALGGFWAGRLAWHLLRDRLGSGVPEDGRYLALRRHWGEAADRRFFWFFQAQAVLAAGLATPFVLTTNDPEGGVTALRAAGILVFALAQFGEVVADRQLARWRADPNNAGRSCRAGLWRYSRHPNYFFEWLTWCGFALVATPAPYGLVSWVCPVVMFVLVTRVSGIPWNEKQALISRGDDYRAYQASTSAFFPWFPRRTA